MSMTRTGTVSAPITIIGKDLDAGATFNADVTPGIGVLKAGTLMSFDVATQILDKAVDGPTTFGILADELDTGAAGATEVKVAMIYREGVFLRQEIESANNLDINTGDANDLALRDKGMILEFSYEGYEGLTPVPPGALGRVAANQEALKAQGGVPIVPPTAPAPTGPTTEPPSVAL